MINNINMRFLDVHSNFLYLNDLYKKRGHKEYQRLLLEPNRFHKNPVLIYTYLVFFLVLYPFSPFYKYIRKVFRHRVVQPKIHSNRNVFLCFTPQLYGLASNANLLNDANIWLVDTAENSSSIKTGTVFYYDDLVSKQELGLALRNSLMCFYKGLRVHGIKSVFLNIWAFDWYVRYYACMHIPADCHIYFCNHIDANYVLVDNLPHKNKTLIQHGTMIIKHNPHRLDYPDFFYNEKYSFWTYNLPYKLKTVNEIYAFTEKEYIACCSSMFVNTPTKHLVGYKLKSTVQVGDPQLKTVLIIGYSQSFASNEEAIVKFYQGRSINLILKVHPWELEKHYQEMKNTYEFTLVSGAVFPSADVVFTYDSTLALEYEELGSHVFYYDDIDFNHLEQFDSLIN